MNLQRLLISSSIITLSLAITITPFDALAKDNKVAQAGKKEKKIGKDFEMSGGEEVGVDKIKKKYWARGNESQIGVVQNRIYSKANRFNLGVIGGVTFVDPFLNVTQVGLTFGYHFNETWGIALHAWRSIAKASSALSAVEEEKTLTVNTNRPQLYYGLESTWSLIYGKLSILGKSIIYYDLHLLAGLGLANTETGNYLTPSAGIGQRFFLSKNFSLRIDYRLMFYREQVAESQITALAGQTLFTRNTFSNTVSLGVDFFF